MRSDASRDFHALLSRLAPPLRLADGAAAASLQMMPGTTTHDRRICRGPRIVAAAPGMRQAARTAGPG